MVSLLLALGYRIKTKASIQNKIGVENAGLESLIKIVE